jgi:glycine cleavage system transcriptional repressor
LINLIITAIGSDRPGIVSELSGIITTHGGNVEESRMSRLGSDFAIIMLVSVSTDWEESLEVALQSINDLTISTKLTQIQEIGDNKNRLECYF